MASVQNLIEELEQIEDKSLPVGFIDDETGNFVDILVARLISEQRSVIQYVVLEP
jgi:hypothetical protein